MIGGDGEGFLKEKFGNLYMLIGSWVPSLILYSAGTFLVLQIAFLLFSLKSELVAVRKPFALFKTQGDSRKVEEAVLEENRGGKSNGILPCPLAGKQAINRHFVLFFSLR